MMAYSLFILWAFAVGCVIPWQSIVNHRLAQGVGHPIPASLISFSGGFLFFIILSFIFPQTWPGFKKIFAQNPIYLMGGVIGSFFIISAIVVIPKIGSTLLIGMVVVGQLIMSLIIDHYGLLGVPVQKISLVRILGVALLSAGSALLLRK